VHKGFKINMHRDLSLGLKMLWKARLYATTAIVTLAVCIGANAAIFTIVNSVLLKPLSVPDADRILLMSNQYPNAGSDASTNSGVPDYFDRLRDMTVFEEQAMYAGRGLAVELDGSPQLVRGMAATPSLFRLLKIAPALGRSFDESEGEIGSEQKVILSSRLWRDLYAAEPDVLGKEMRLAGLPYTIVGVMPEGFEFADPEARFWIPLAFTAEEKSDDRRHSNNWYHIGRLKPGTTLEQAQAQVDAINAANLDRFPQFKELLINAGFHTSVERLQDVLVRSVARTLYLLWGGAAFVLLVGALNIANLALARSTLRTKELGTRVALGAGRGRIASQLVVEGLIVALIAGVLGAAIAAGMLRALESLGLDRLPRGAEVHMDLTVFGTILIVSAVAGVLIGLVPLLHVPRANLSGVLQESSRGGTGGTRVRSVRRILVVAEVAFAFVLLIGSGLLVASFRNLLAVNPGFDSNGVITASVLIPRASYPELTDIRVFVDRALTAIRAVPGVVNAGGTTIIPLSGNNSDSVILAEGYEMQPGESLVSPMQIVVTPGYFEAMSTPLVRGRFFTEGDDETSPGAVIVDERLARKFWPGADPIGRRMYQPSDPQDLLAVNENTKWLTVVGVVREVQLKDLAGSADSVGAYYFPAKQQVRRFLVFAIKAAIDPNAVMRSVRAAMSEIDPSMPLATVRTMEDYTALSLMPRRTAMILATSFGIVALLLAAIGMYGVLAYLVAQRMREIGVRLALGSTTRGIMRLVLREGAVLVLSGLAIGLIGALALRSVLASQVFGLGALDPMVIGAAVLVLGATAFVACALPARRAAQVNPAVALNR
jgi:putative ABC transport system permease protein